VSPPHSTLDLDLPQQATGPNCTAHCLLLHHHSHCKLDALRQMGGVSPALAHVLAEKSKIEAPRSPAPSAMKTHALGSSHTYIYLYSLLLLLFLIIIPCGSTKKILDTTAHAFVICRSWGYVGFPALCCTSIECLSLGGGCNCEFAPKFLTCPTSHHCAIAEGGGSNCDPHMCGTGAANLAHISRSAPPSPGIGDAPAHPTPLAFSASGLVGDETGGKRQVVRQAASQLACRQHPQAALFPSQMVR
jgi:hypothetical protein